MVPTGAAAALSLQLQAEDGRDSPRPPPMGMGGRDSPPPLVASDKQPNAPPPPDRRRRGGFGNEWWNDLAAAEVRIQKGDPFHDAVLLLSREGAQDLFVQRAPAPPGRRGETSVVAQLSAALAQQRRAFAAEPYPTLEQRVDRLLRFSRAIMAHREELKEALRMDFVTESSESSDLEVLSVVERIQRTVDALPGWMAAEEREPSGAARGGAARAAVFRQPKGVVCNMAPWSAPYDCGFGPVVEMIAAGNRVVLKPSDLSVHAGAAMVKVISAAFPDGVVRGITGGLDLAKACATLRWDHLMYTGGTAGGRSVALAAAGNLIPVTLELGGKSPVIITEDCVSNPGVAAAVAAAKLRRNGQACTAVDYVLVPKGHAWAFAERFAAAVRRMVPGGYVSDPGIAGMISDEHMMRVNRLVADASSRGCPTVQIGGEADAASRRPPFTILLDPPADALVMKEEVFGPVLPIVSYDDIDAALAAVTAGERPLSVGLFSGDAALGERVKRETVAGAYNFNSCSGHHSQPHLGFGGSGKSGMGRHHGWEGFMEFSNPKAVFEQPPVGEKLGKADLCNMQYSKSEVARELAATVAEIEVSLLGSKLEAATVMEEPQQP